VSSRPSSLAALAGHAGPIVAGKAIQYVGALLFVTLVPRLMGPAVYGPFAVYVSLLIVLSMLGDFGTLLIYGRFVPTLQNTRDDEKLTWLFSQLLVFKTLAGSAIGLVFVAVGRFVMPAWPALWLWLGGGTLLLRVAADNCYHLAFGLNQTARWIARESLRNIVQFALVGSLFARFGPQGAVIALFLTDLGFLALGLSWARRYWRWEGVQLGALGPYLRYGLYFFIANACLMAFQRGGSVLLALWHVPAPEIAYFDLAFNVFLILYGTMTQLVLSVVPALIVWQAAAREAEVTTALNLLWQGSAIVAVILFAAIWPIADPLVVLVFGAAYAPAASHLRIVIADLVPLALGQMSFVVASVYRRPAIPLWAGLITLGAFLALAAGLIPRYGSLGPVLASFGAMVAYAATTFVLARSVLRVDGWRTGLAFLRSRLATSWGGEQ